MTATATGAAARPAPRRAASAASLLRRPLTSYYLIIGASVLLLAIGLVMVLSTTSAAQLSAGQPPYALFKKQLLGVAVGLPMMWALSRASARLFRTIARPAMFTAAASLAFVLAFGTSANGAERWIKLGPVTVQPSEFAKLALVLWGADLLARKEQLRQLTDWRSLLVPLLPGAAIVVLLVKLGHDIGTTFLLLVILLALLWVIGTPGRLFAGLLALVTLALLLQVVTTAYATSRLTGFLSPAGGPTGPNMQSIQGKWAIGSGGLFGVGLGNSAAKWGWVPEASNDFVFAILGEELGLIGTVSVVLLYSGLAYSGLRVARRVTDPFMRLAAAGVTAWISVQALVNICAVVGLLPITGVPLPLISDGLSSLLVTMAALGMLLSFARREPGAQEALAAARPGRLRRLVRPGSPAAAAPGPSPLRRSQPPRSRPHGRSPGPPRATATARSR
jgi:cell division protein FtsW